jgi:hypothetical protein
MATWGTVKELLGGVNETSRDNIVSMEPRDPCAPPPVINQLYREIMQDNMRIAQMESNVAQMQDAIAKAEREISAAKRVKLEKQERWIMITRNLGIDIQEEPEGVE